MKKVVTGMIVLLLSILLVACGDDTKKEEQTTETNVEVTDAERVDTDQVVAVINGDEVKGEIYNLIYTQLKTYAGQFGESVDEEEIKEATMESIIDRQLVLQQAKEEGIEITDDVTDEEFATLKKDSPDALENLLTQYQITEEGFKEQLKFEMTMNEYMAKTIKVTVSDDELKENYEKAKEGNDEIPPFDEVKDQMKKQMLQQKTQEAFQKKIDKVKEKADIVEKI